MLTMDIAGLSTECVGARLVGDLSRGDSLGAGSAESQELERKLEEFEFPGAPDLVHMQLELFVSCNINGKPRTVKIFQSSKGYDDCEFEDSPCPRTSGV